MAVFCFERFQDFTRQQEQIGFLHDGGTVLEFRQNFSGQVCERFRRRTVFRENGETRRLFFENGRQLGDDFRRKNEFPHVYIRFSGVAVKGFGKDDQEIPSAHAIAFSIHGKAGAALIKRNNFHFAVQVQFEMDFLVVKDLRPIVVLVEIIHKAFSLLKDIFGQYSALYGVNYSRNSPIIQVGF